MSGSDTVVAASTAGTEPWWKQAVVQQIYARSFADSNGDGAAIWVASSADWTTGLRWGST